MKRSLKYTDEQIVAMRIAGMGMHALRKKAGVGMDRLQQILNDAGLPTRKRDSDDCIRACLLERNILEAYDPAHGISTTQLSEKFKIDHDVVYRLLKRNGRECIPYRKMFFDFDFFSRSTKEVAYHAGFGYADGSIGKNPTGGSWVYSVGIHEKDVCVLQDLCSSVGIAEEFIKRYQRAKTPLVQLSLVHDNLPGHMVRWGIVPNKTYEKFQVEIDDEMLPYYLLGWADGDGSMSKIKDGKYFRHVFSLTSYHAEPLEFFRHAVLNLLHFSGNVGIYKDPRKHAYYLRVNGLDSVRELRDLLRVDDSFHLRRKWDKIIEAQT